jgi:hypothetical protein
VKSHQEIAYLALEQVLIDAREKGLAAAVEPLEEVATLAWAALSKPERLALRAREGTLAEKNDTQVYIGGELVLGPHTEKS